MPHTPANNNNQTTGRRRSDGLPSQDGSAPAAPAPSTTSRRTSRLRHVGTFTVTYQRQIVESCSDTAAVETDSSSSDAAPVRTTAARSRRDAAGESSRPDLTSGRRAAPWRTSSAMASAFARMNDDVGCALPSDPDAGPDGDYMPPAWSALRDGVPPAGDADGDSGDEYGQPLAPPSEAELFDRHLSDSALGIPAEPGSGKTRPAGRRE